MAGVMEAPFVFLMTRGWINDDMLQLEKLRPLRTQTFGLLKNRQLISP